MEIRNNQHEDLFRKFALKQSVHEYKTIGGVFWSTDQRYNLQISSFLQRLQHVIKATLTAIKKNQEEAIKQYNQALENLYKELKSFIKGEQCENNNDLDDQIHEIQGHKLQHLFRSGFHMFVEADRYRYVSIFEAR